MRQLGDGQEGLILRRVVILVEELGGRAPSISWNRHRQRTTEAQDLSASSGGKERRKEILQVGMLKG